MARNSTSLQLVATESLLEALIDPQRIRTALQTMATLLEADAAALAVGRPEGGIRELITTTAAADATLTAFALLNPYRLAVPALPAGRLYSSEALLPARALARSSFYRRWLAEGPVRAGCIGWIELGGGEIGTLGFGYIGNAGEARGFDAAAIAAVERLMPHLQRVLSLQHRFDSQRAIGAAAIGRYERYRIGTLVVDGEGRVLFANSVAQQLCERGEGLLLRNGYIDALAPAEAATLMQAIRDCLLPDAVGHGAGAVRLLRVSRSGGGAPFSLACSASGDARAREVHAGAASRGQVVIMIHDPERTPLESREAARGLLGLSERDTELACLLADGDTLEAIARRTGRSLEAVRSQLKRIYRKTGTSRQTELVRLVLNGTAAIAH